MTLQHLLNVLVQITNEVGKLKKNPETQLLEDDS
jgi:hypothetical protein